MGCGKSKDAVATGNTITKSQSNKKEDVVVGTTANANTTTPNALVVKEKGESKKDEVINKVVEKVGGVGEITKEEFEGGAKEETKSEDIVATDEKIIGVGGSEKSKDVVEEKGLDEEAKMETTTNGVGEQVKEKEEKEEAAAQTIDTKTPPAAIAAATPTAASEEETTLVSNQEIVAASPAEQPKTN
ncbi:hypothetical protein RHSIM_Rhsim04G0217400 [Rhododendron simsii]|uniref:Uncharacterized protein n=1 Tax=Rhododendron simsii TaxID=118357 RepID=A0A834H3L1_RHOSS|nr:hypothetical protein RHSIM_Rhsim04G0217400 [Rhododendron simsii]